MVEANKHIIFKDFLALMRLIYAVFILLLALMTSAQCQQTAEDWLNKGVALASQGKYDEAIKAYDEAITAEDWLNKGLALYG
jgi:tetratricopeptide (TPR) repeat protein